MPANDHYTVLPEPQSGTLPLVQQRSRLRQDRILSEAGQIIADIGSDGLRMNALAERCGISIGSLYQHFRDKRALLAAIAARYHAATRDCIDDALGQATDWASFSAAFAELIDAYHKMFLNEPVIRDVWSGIAADKTLQALERQSARENGDHLARHILRVAPDASREDVADAAFFVMAMGESVMRLSILCPPDEQHQHVARYTRMALTELGQSAISKPDRAD